jgi:hypothetical protein
MGSSKYSSELPSGTLMKDFVAIAKGLTLAGFEAFRSTTELYADACVTKASATLLCLFVLFW